MPTAKIHISINGEERDFPEPLTVAELVRTLEIRSPAVAVEVNRAIVPRSEHPRRRLEDGDQVEIVSFVGGG